MASLRRTKSEFFLSSLRSVDDSTISSHTLLALPNENNITRHSFIKTLLSTPLMKPVINVAKKFDTLGIVDGLEENIFSVLSDAMHDPSSPWFKLLPKSPSVTGPRTPEQYLCALDVAIKARKETKDKKKTTKFWKRLALQASPPDEDIPITPSPSDISDTGIADPLSPSRKYRLEELIGKRKAVALDCSSRAALRPDTNSNYLDGLPVSLLTQDFASEAEISRDTDFSGLVPDVCEFLTASREPVTTSVHDLDVTLVDSKEEVAASLTKIPTLKRPQTLPPSLQRLAQNAKSPSLSKMELKTHTCCKTLKSTESTSHKPETGPFTSVQTKRRMYESLASRPSSSLPFRRLPVITSTPIAANIKSRRVSIKSPHSPSPFTSEYAVAVKRSMKTQNGASVKSSTNRSDRTQVNSSRLPQTRRTLTNSSQATP